MTLGIYKIHIKQSTINFNNRVAYATVTRVICRLFKSYDKTLVFLRRDLLAGSNSTRRARQMNGIKLPRVHNTACRRKPNLPSICNIRQKTIILSILPLVCVYIYLWTLGLQDKNAHVRSTIDSRARVTSGI